MRSRTRSAARSRWRRPGSGYSATTQPAVRRIHEERESDRDLEARPQLVGQLEVGEPQRAVAGGAILGIARAQRPAALARRTRSCARPAAAGGGGPAGMVVPHRSQRSCAVDWRQDALTSGPTAADCDGPPAGRPIPSASPRRPPTSSAAPPAPCIASASGAGGALTRRAGSLTASSATFTCPCSRSSGTGSSWSRSSSIERPARGRK